MSDPFETWDGAYVLGALSDDERTEFEAHLDTCDQCTDRVAQLRRVTPLMDLLDAQSVDELLASCGLAEPSREDKNNVN